MTSAALHLSQNARYRSQDIITPGFLILAALWGFGTPPCTCWCKTLFDTHSQPSTRDEEAS